MKDIDKIYEECKEIKKMELLADALRKQVPKNQNFKGMDMIQKEILCMICGFARVAISVMSLSMMNIVIARIVVSGLIGAMRKEMVKDMKKIISDIKAELLKMQASRDEAYIKTYIPWEDNRGFSVECIRDDEDSNVYDQDGKLIDDRRGTPIEFRVYYQINHYDEDCCTLTSGLNLKDLKELAAFVNMYNW